MRKFVFRLQAALDHAQRLEEEAALELAALESKQQAARQELSELLKLCERMSEELKEAQTGSLKMAEVQARRRHLDHSWALVAEQRQLLMELETTISQQRERLVSLLQKRQVLARLRETHALEHHRAVMALELVAQDEVSTIKYSRRQLGAK